MTDLSTLSQVNSIKGISLLAPAATPGEHCPLHAIVTTGSMISGLSMLVVGSAECTFYSRGPANRTKDRGRKKLLPENIKVPSLSWSYTMSESETVFGCADSLEAAIIEMLADGASPLMVVTTCIPHVIGEDIAALCEKISAERGAKVFEAGFAHFSCISTSKGTSAALAGLVKIMDDTPANPVRINLIGGGKDDADFPEITDFLISAGYKLVRLGGRCDIDDCITAPSARLNLIMAPEGAALAEGMKKRFGAEYIDLSAPVSPDDISESIIAINKLLEKDISPGIDILNLSGKIDQIKALEKTAADCLAGKRFILGPGASQTPLRTALYLTCLGMVPAAIHIEDFTSGELLCREKLLERGFDPIAGFMLNDFFAPELYNNPDGENNPGDDIVLGFSHRQNRVRGEKKPLGYDRLIQLLNNCLDSRGGAYGTSAL